MINIRCHCFVNPFLISSKTTCKMVYYEEGEKYDYRHVLEPIDFELEEGAFRFIQTIFLLKMDETEKGKEVIRQLEKEVETIEMCRTFANQLDKPLVIPLRKERIEQIG